MPKTAFLFAGQGAQSVGMGRDLCEKSPAARALFEKADRVLGIPLSRVCFEGPESELNRTDTCQPALLVAALAALAALREAIGPARWADPQAAAGLSLGEYSALVCAGALGEDDALRLVRLRGLAMQEDCDREPSGMAAVLGLDRDQVQAACEAARGSGVVGPANLLGPGNIAISGARAAVEAAGAKARELGAKRVLPLKVAGAFHSSLMSGAEQKLREALTRTPVQDPKIPVVANVSGEWVRTAESVRSALGAQVSRPVLWEDSMRRLAADGCTRFIEFGPGKVLSGLMRKIGDGLDVRVVENAADVAREAAAWS